MENSSLTLTGYSSENWSFSELWWRDCLVCRVYTTSLDCHSPDTPYLVTRLRGVERVPGNTTMVQFRIPGIQANESGVWNITMALNPPGGGRPETDSRLLVTTVTHRATVGLSGTGNTAQ